jgi:hypothetical protein
MEEELQEVAISAASKKQAALSTTTKSKWEQKALRGQALTIIDLIL